MSEKILTPREVAEKLSFREFQGICTFFDLKLGAGSKFEVLNILRTKGRCLAMCRGEDGEVYPLGWNNVVEMPSVERRKTKVA